MRILVVGDQTLSFVAQDIQLLSTYGKPEVFTYRNLSDWPALFMAIRGSDLVLSWFCDIHAYAATTLARLSRRPSVVMDLPSHGFRELCDRPKLRRLNRWTLNHADKIIAPSLTVAREMQNQARCMVEMIPLAVNTAYFRPHGPKYPKTVLTVARVRDRAHYRRKNIPCVIATARAMPDVKFTLIGAGPHMIDMAREDGPWPDNLFLIPETKTNDSILLDSYQISTVYFQPSTLEGFGMACAEAMACECVPVVSPTLKFIVGGAGHIIEYQRDAPAAIEAALRDEGRAKLARERIKSFFDIENRRERLVKTLEEVFLRSIRR